MAEEQKVSGQQAATAVEETSDFASLLNQEFRPKSDRAKEEISSAVETLAEYVLKDTAVVSEDAVASIESLIAQI
ncbi:MAG: type VI secretion system contractile sheath large subunit, partial [Xanthomonadales bacterium]|nr:type VI secretion system contractile sheath large subunit [Xanthomonadales bacterium]